MADVEIILSGAESSGKSTLSRQLAAHYRAPWCPEYARDYLEKNGPSYGYEDFIRIVEGHLARYHSFRRENRGLLFCDTDLLNLYIWAEMVFGKIPDILYHQMTAGNSHKYLLLYPDLPWESDPLRENDHNRLQIFERHRKLVEDLKRPYEIVMGQGEERLQNAVKSVQKLLGEKR